MSQDDKNSLFPYETVRSAELSLADHCCSDVKVRTNGYCGERGEVIPEGSSKGGFASMEFSQDGGTFGVLVVDEKGNKHRFEDLTKVVIEVAGGSEIHHFVTALKFAGAQLEDLLRDKVVAV